MLNTSWKHSQSPTDRLVGSTALYMTSRAVCVRIPALIFPIEPLGRRTSGHMPQEFDILPFWVFYSSNTADIKGIYTYCIWWCRICCVRHMGSWTEEGWSVAWTDVANTNDQPQKRIPPHNWAASQSGHVQRGGPALFVWSCHFQILLCALKV